MRLKLIALALLAGGQVTALSAQPVIQAVSERPRIVVDGHGEAKTMPDIATITYTVRGEGAASDDAVRAMVAEASRIETSLLGINAGTEPKTGDVKVEPVKSDDCKERDYDAKQLSTGACAVAGYVATQSITVRTPAIKDAGTMVGVISRGGGYDAEISSFGLADPRAAQRQAMAAALADADSKAVSVASGSHVTRGPIISINTTGRSLDQPIVVTGSREVRANAPAPPPPVVVKVTPEPITTTADVTVTYAIVQ